MTLKEQHYIVTLADCGSITQAARRLGVSQPALSSYLAGVEGRLGHPLFSRAGQRLSPTYLGELYLEKARKILALGEEFDQQLEQVQNGFQGRLRVGMPIRRSPQVIPSVLKLFVRRYPGVELIFQEGNLGQMEKLLLDNQLDLMLLSKTKERPELEYAHLSWDKVVFLVQSTHPLCRHARYRQSFRRPWIDLKEFEQEVFFLQHPEQSLRCYTDQILEQTGTHPGRVTLIRNIEASSQLAAEGLGVSFCLESYLRHMRFIQPPQAFSVGERQLAADFSAAYRQGRPLPEYALEFIQLLKELSAMEPGD